MSIAFGGSALVWPIDSVDMPPPGPDFVLEGERSISAEELYYQAIYKPGFTLPVQISKGVKSAAIFVPGHLWGDGVSRAEGGNIKFQVPTKGPQPAKRMIIGKMPWDEETSSLRYFVGKYGNVLIDSLNRAGCIDLFNVYVTAFIKFRPPNRSKTINAAWRKDCRLILEQELRIVQPDYILLLGSDVCRELLDINYSEAEGKIIDYSYWGGSPDNPVRKTAKVVVAINPAQVAISSDQVRVLDRSVQRWVALTSGVISGEEDKESDLDHQIVSDVDSLNLLLQKGQDYLNSLPESERFVAWDAEWQGRFPTNKDSYLRTIQFSWKEKQAVVIKLRDENGNLVFKDKNTILSYKEASSVISSLLNSFMEGKRPVGHFIVNDIVWLQHFGVDLLKFYRHPLFPISSENGVAPWKLYKLRGGMDTALIQHAVEEASELGLEKLASRYTSAPRYDLTVEHDKNEYCRVNKVTKRKISGFGFIKDSILLPYAAYDADVTLRILKVLLPKLESDYLGHNCWEPAWESACTVWSIYEIQKNGLRIDLNRFINQTKLFEKHRTILLDKLKSLVNWHSFNPRSPNQVRELLFGEKYNGKLDGNGRPVVLRPTGALALNIRPIVTTGKPAKTWDEVEASGEEAISSPSTGKTVLSILLNNLQGIQFDVVKTLKEWRLIDQAVKHLVTPADEKGFYETGLGAFIDDDRRVRTMMSPTADTGRCKSSRPNLQNISSSRDHDYKSVLGDEYKVTMRGMFKAPKHHFLIEADYKGAELHCAAIMSGDQLLLEHVRRNQLDKSHPDFFDIHSYIAVTSFNLDCPPTQEGLKKIDKLYLRSIAKTIIFRLFYGCGVQSILLALRQERDTSNATVEQVRKVINTVFSNYSELLSFFDACRKRVVNPGWMKSCFGRLRRFPKTIDDNRRRDLERVAMNFPIQSMVSSVLNRSLMYLLEAGKRYKNKYGQKLFKLWLTIHDSAILCVHRDNLEYVREELLPWAMSKSVPIWPTDLDGNRIRGRGPYYLSIDTGISKYWSEKISPLQIKKKTDDAREKQDGAIC